MRSNPTRPTHAALCAQMSDQLFFKHSASLNEKAAIDGFVGHARVLVVGVLIFEPARDLLGRPLQHQFTCHKLSYGTVQQSKHGLGRNAECQARRSALLAR